MFLTSGGSEIESSQDMCRSYSDRPSIQVWSRAMLVIFLRNRWVSRERSLYQALSGRGLTQVLRIGGGGRGAPSLYLQRRCLGLTQDKVQYVSFVCHKDQIENTWKEVECL